MSETASEVLGHFAEAVRATFDPAMPDSFWKCTSEFQRLLGRKVLEQLLNAELRRMTEDPMYLGDWRPQQLFLIRDTAFTLSLTTLDEQRRYIHSMPYYAMFAPVGKQPLTYDLYRFPAHYRNDTFDPGLQLERAGSGQVDPAQILQLRTREYAYDFKITQPVVILRFATATIETQEWLFSKETLHPWQANDSEIGATQQRVAAYVLGRIAHQSSLETLEMLAEHPNHSVRWAAIQSLGRISRAAALERLQRALSDPHPHIRRAAEKTLAHLNRKVGS